MNKIISLAIATRISQGMTVSQAIDDVLGAGTFDRMVGDVYDAMRAKV